MGTFSFAEGKDGGRDGRFEGVAQSFPSTASPLRGKFIVQAKHTSNPGASCSDAQFGQILKGEKPKIRKLAAAGEIDHYLLFTNRKLSASREVTLHDELLRIPNVQTAAVFGTESMKSYIVKDRSIWRDLGFESSSTPFRFNPDDLVSVIAAFHAAVTNSGGSMNGATNFTFVDKKQKNKLNKLTPAYYEYIQTDSLPYFDKIKVFLENPRNETLRSTYHEAADELKVKIITFRDRFKNFDEVLIYLYDEIVNNGNVKIRRKLVRVFLDYMYFDCDIGKHA